MFILARYSISISAGAISVPGGAGGRSTPSAFQPL
jgi:hypothetical protein